jgi:hypothetical protein
VPGDVDAYFYTFVNQTATRTDGMIISAISDGTKRADLWYHWLDSSELAVLTGGATATTGTGTASDNYIRWTSAGSASTNMPTGVPYSTDGLLWDDFDYWLASTPARVYALARTSSLNNKIRMTWTGATSGTGEYMPFVTANTWELLPLGLLNTTSRTKDGAIIIPSISITFSTGTVDLDALIFMPANDGLIVVPKTTGSASTPYFYFDGTSDTVSHTRPIGLSLFTNPIVPHYGQVGRAAAGGVSTRFVFYQLGQMSGGEQDFAIATASTMTTSITPRTSHLLGTI